MRTSAINESKNFFVKKNKNLIIYLNRAIIQIFQSKKNLFEFKIFLLVVFIDIENFHSSKNLLESCAPFKDVQTTHWPMAVVRFTVTKTNNSVGHSLTSFAVKTLPDGRE